MELTSLFNQAHNETASRTASHQVEVALAARDTQKLWGHRSFSLAHPQEWSNLMEAVAAGFPDDQTRQPVFTFFATLAAIVGRPDLQELAKRRKSALAV